MQLAVKNGNFVNSNVRSSLQSNAQHDENFDSAIANILRSTVTEVGGVCMTNKRSLNERVVTTGLMMALVVVMTMIIRVPVPATNGYIHLGDCMIFFSVLLLGWKWGAAAAGIGSALADLFAGYASYAPITLVIKGLMAVVMGLCIDYAIKKGFSKIGLQIVEVSSMIVSGLFMVTGYYLYASIISGNFIVPLSSIPMNCIQFGVGVVLAKILAMALTKTPARNLFEYVSAI